MPRLIRLYVTQVLVGFAISAVFIAGLLWLDIAGLRGLIVRSDSALLAVFMLWFMNGIVFAGVQFAWKIMSLAEDDTPPRGGSKVSDLRPVPVRQEAPAHRG
ncbi:hypothetical protein KQ247_17710 [Ruegeria pomeroyi]|jgi:hypothetical protein|uniref:Uncharacterized protein n=2 Tax=Ruegeria pomeroyi TaxID=89184 RepID=Q5LSK2_RUEPO|nr:hypothetical protein [Ruegeria pomeroyi]HCE70681.1 hypothetical protein [Ruegeria sp.]AAV95045.1 hypothetical protein SPO1765 [Ruegeria pomeroyi DSS-3]NVK98091.1 hypothetical protein [Ruegeria pomeroyi]NVL01811.1 hypothetical protein [Ruegeria pomeroyi]QWV08622.1 hypothetical protein KQ247_17710 [Ruegeria pomeroyi]